MDACVNLFMFPVQIYFTGFLAIARMPSGNTIKIE
jgi:hypothetical protein